MKSTHLRKRIVAALLAVVLAVSLAAPSLAIEETGVSKSGSNGLTWEEIDSSSVQVESPHSGEYRRSGKDGRTRRHRYGSCLHYSKGRLYTGKGLYL